MLKGRSSPRDAKRLDKYYDQIAWFTDGGERQLKLRYVKGGKIEFTNYLSRDLDLSRSDLQYRVSDHYPLWVEFECRHISKIKAEQNRRKTRKHARTRTTVPDAGTDSPAMVTGAEGGGGSCKPPTPNLVNPSAALARRRCRRRYVRLSATASRNHIVAREDARLEQVAREPRAHQRRYDE
jgi:hypothetical protein